MMTRKTYETAARAIRETRPDEPGLDLDLGRDLACDEIADDLADMFAADNPRFDRERFLAATQRER